MCKKIMVSSLPKTWILDLDGTVVIHNGYKIYGEDKFLDGALDFLKAIPKEDMIIFLTSRKKEYQIMTEVFLRKNGVRWNYIIYDVPYGERFLVNDRKPSGIPMAFSINTIRDNWMEESFCIDDKL